MKKNFLILAIISLFALIAMPAGAVCDNNPVDDVINSQCCCCCPSSSCGGSTLVTPISIAWQNAGLYQELRGKIIVRSKALGEAYFVDPGSRVFYYLPDFDMAYKFFMSRGISTSRANLAKIPVGILPVTGDDSDRDGLSDQMEIAVGTNKDSFNSDNDIYSDKVELANNYNPNGPGRPRFDMGFAQQQAGRFLTQSDVSGAVWYVSPRNNRRYFVGNRFDALNLIKQVGIGISEQNFNLLMN